MFEFCDICTKKREYEVIQWSDDENRNVLLAACCQGHLRHFEEKYDVESYPYYSYFRALALGGSGESGKANIIFSQLANYNFNDLEVALVKSLAKKQLG